MGQLDTLNPIGRLGKVLQGAASPAPSPSAAALKRNASGDIDLPAERKVSQVDWVNAAGKRMSGTAAERDADLAKKRSPTTSRSLRK